jgi:hypothetical protein
MFLFMKSILYSLLLSTFFFSCSESGEKKATNSSAENPENSGTTAGGGAQLSPELATREFSRSGTPVPSNSQVQQTDPSLPEPIQNETVDQRMAPTATSNDNTLKVAGRAVVIYFPTTEDMLNTPETDANAGFVEVLSEFEQEARVFQQSHGLQGVQVFWSTDRFFSVQLADGSKQVFERNMVDRLVGVIFTDGKRKPVEELSLLSAEEYRQRAKKFFGQ